MAKNLMLIVNRFSGRGLSDGRLGLIVNTFCEADYDVMVYTTKSGSPEELTRAYAEKYDLVVCAGGDGTLSAVATGLMELASPPPFGLIPAGTANDMASTLSLPRDMKTAALNIINGHPVPLDMGVTDSWYFVYIAAFGAFTGVSYATTQGAKRALGHLAYVLGGLVSMTTIKPRHTVVTYDGGVIEGDFIFGGVTNSTSIAGFVRLDKKDVDLGDGLFEVILVRNPVNTAELLAAITSILNHSYQSENVLLLHTKKITFRFDEPVAWTKDGEDGGLHQELVIENRRHALQIII